MPPRQQETLYREAARAINDHAWLLDQDEDTMEDWWNCRSRDEIALIYESLEAHQITLSNGFTLIDAIRARIKTLMIANGIPPGGGE